MIAEVISGSLVSAIATTGRWAVGELAAPHGERSKKDTEIISWFDNYQLSDRRPDLSNLPRDLTEEAFSQAIESNEVQASLQELIAARLTDAPSSAIEQVKQCFTSALQYRMPTISIANVADSLFDYYDSETCRMTGELRGRQPTLFQQLRDDAFNVRIVAILNALNSHTSSIRNRPSAADEVQYLANYRSHISDFHGKLQPPDFDRRQRVPIADIYVSPTIVPFVSLQSNSRPAKHRLRRRETIRQFDLDDELPESDKTIPLGELSKQLDRTVLLGDPGGGKSTAANVLMYQHACDSSRRLPFLVILREYASDGGPSRSIIGHIEHKLETFYQCEPPRGLIERLCLSGQAVIIFDGLDELIDTSRRIEVTEAVENFCLEFPLTRVLVTSRLVGYDQARLDTKQFSCYRLAGFSEKQVVEYVRKWFAQDEELSADDGQRWTNSFIEESANVSDLRSNPLMLALMCILYQGEGSIPHNRPEVYEQCADLLFRKWDTRRRISVELRASHLIEPALRHLAYWLFVRNVAQSAVTEAELVRETTSFLRGRGFESEDEAAEAAKQFVAFCRGRAWVFSDTGTTAVGEILYTFTHRTFLEYFAAAYLAITSDTPEQLGKVLLPHVAKAEWEVVAELAVQKKDQINDRGAERAITAMLNEKRQRAPLGRSNVLQFLVRCIASIDVPPRVVREVSQAVISHLMSGDLNDPIFYAPLAYLSGAPVDRCVLVAEEIATNAARHIESQVNEERLSGLRLAVYQDVAGFSLPEVGLATNGKFWAGVARTARTMYAELIRDAIDDASMMQLALSENFVNFGEILGLDDISLGRFYEGIPLGIYGISWAAYLPWHIEATLSTGATYDESSHTVFTALGRFLIDHPDTPWCTIKDIGGALPFALNFPDVAVEDSVMDQVTYLGFIAAVCMALEIRGYVKAPGGLERWQELPRIGEYIAQRWAIRAHNELPELMLPSNFSAFFQRWAGNSLSFCKFL